MNFFVILVFVGLAAADVSHIASNYLPPRLSSGINYNHGSDVIVSRPVVSTYTAQPEITYSRQVNVAPSVQVIGSGYDSGLIGSGGYGGGLISSGLSGGGGYGGGLISSGLSGGGYGGGIISSGLSGGGGYGGGGLISSYDSGYQGSGLIGSGLSGLGTGGGSILHTISAPVVSNAYESVGTQYGSNGGYVYQKKH